MKRIHELRRNERVRPGSTLPQALSPRGEVALRWIAFGTALLLHGVAMLVPLPDLGKSATPKKSSNVIVVRRYIPPPPKVERTPVAPKARATRRVPLPDPTPDEPEPIREPEPEIAPEPLPVDVDVLIGVPTPPPPAAPLLAGTGGVTVPVLIEESRVKPEYPELARRARLEGDVILQAIIRRDGSVGDLDVLRCTRPMLGFEEAAVAAVQQWRYEPATQGGRPVEVYFTVFVEFTLL